MQVVDHFLVRVAGLPWEALDVTDCPRTLALAQRLDRLRAELDSSRPDLCERLFQSIAGQTDTKLRRMLLKLKRAVHNGRAPTAPVSQLRQSLVDDVLVRDLLAWESCITQYLQLLHEGQETGMQELSTVMERLRQSWHDPSFQTGLLMAQPQLYQRLQEFLQNEQSRDRRLEGSALAYFFRTATKTSPFSTFTATGFGQFGISETGFIADAPPVISSQFALNTTISDRLALAIRLHEKSPAHLPLKLNETVCIETDRVLFLRTGASSVSTMIALGIKESVMSVARNALLDAIVALLGDPRQSTTAGVLVRRLYEQWNGKISPDKLAAVVQQLLTTGLVRLSPAYDNTDVHELSNLADCLANWDDPTAQRWARRMVAIEEALDALPNQPPPGQVQELNLIAETTQHLFEELTADPPAVSAQGLVHHDCYVNDHFTLDTVYMAAPLQDLADLTSVMPLFNSHHRFNELAVQFFRDTYARGTAVPILHFFRDFHDGQTQSERSTRTSQPGMAGLLSVREQFIEQIRSAIAQDEAGQSVHLARDMVREFGARADPFRPQGIPLCVGYFGQLATPGQSDTPPVFVVNQVVAGYGHYMARFTNSPEHVDIPGQRLTLDRLRRRLAQLEQQDCEAVEVLGTFGYNGQIHPRVTRRYLAYPGETVAADPTSRITWQNVMVTCNEGSNAIHLVSQPDGRRLLPISLSPAAPQLMPSFFQFVTSLGLAFRPSFSILEVLEAQISPERRKQVRRYPRIYLGQAVLARETWCIPSTRLPAATERLTEFESFRSLRAWARELGLPRYVFAIPERLTEYLQSDKPAHNPRRVYKPFYVDFDSPLSCQIFRRFTEGITGTLTVTEMLPAPGQLFLRRGGRRYVSEFLLEFCEERG